MALERYDDLLELIVNQIFMNGLISRLTTIIQFKKLKEQSPALSVWFFNFQKKLHFRKNNRIDYVNNAIFSF